MDTKLNIKDLVKMRNIAEELSPQQLAEIGSSCMQGYESDKASRAEWEQWYEDALKLALQVTEIKTFPWENCSNIKFPLITIGALHFHARAYPALLGSREPVQCYVPFEDKNGGKTARATRISRHMSYQILEEDESWEENHDRLLLALSIVGTVFKKCYFDPVKKNNVSELVLAKDLVVNYWTRNLEDASRITHILYLPKNKILNRIRRGLYLEKDLISPAMVLTDGPNAARDESQKVYPGPVDDATPYEFLEQHTWLDLDGDDFLEPYIVTMNAATGEVFRIVANYFADSITYNSKKEVTDIKAGKWFVKYGFIPSPDGGFYDLGFGLLQGPLNESINSLINQLVDSGTMSNLGGGFLSRNIKMKGGNYTFSPGEWKRIESTGDELARNIFPLPIREPSQVLLSLLTFLVGYAERISFANDVQMGENPGQNTPANTMEIMNENGQRIFSGIYKRNWRAMREEFRMLYHLNAMYFQANKSYGDLTRANPPIITIDDYLGPEIDVRPAADSNFVSGREKLQRDTMVMQNAATIPGHNVYAAVKRVYDDMMIPNIEEIYPDPKGQNAPQPQPSMDMLNLQLEQQKLQMKQQEMQITTQLKVLELQGEAQLNAAKIMELQAKAMKEVEEAKGVSSGHVVGIIQQQVAAAKSHQDSLLKAIEVLMKGKEIEAKQARDQRVEGSSGNG